MPVSRRLLLVVTLALAACSQRDKKPRLHDAAVVGAWRSDTVTGPDSVRRVFALTVARNGKAEFVRSGIGRDTIVERGTWDGADSLLRVVVQPGDAVKAASSLLFVIHGDELGLVRFDPAVWGPNGLVLVRR